MIFAGWLGAYGNAVIIDHGAGMSTLYGHQSQLLVREGDTVAKGQIIGRVGGTSVGAPDLASISKSVRMALQSILAALYRTTELALVVSTIDGIRDGYAYPPPGRKGEDRPCFWLDFIDCFSCSHRVTY